VIALKIQGENSMKKTQEDLMGGVDLETAHSFKLLEERQEAEKNRLTNIKNVLVVLPATAMAFDRDALRFFILQAYPNAHVIFWSASGQTLGNSPRTNQVDLAIDFSAPGQFQGIFFARKIKRLAKTTVGRNAGLFRKRIYDRVFDETAILNQAKHTTDTFYREMQIQKKVLALAGVACIPAANTTSDRSKMIALELPPLASS
jgi:hypothetical protein